MNRKYILKRISAAILALVLVVTGISLPKTGQKAEAAESNGLIDYQSMSFEDLINSEENLTWVFTGDSITHVKDYTAGRMGYMEYTEQRLMELGRTKDTILNTAYSNMTIKDLYKDLKTYVTRYNPDIVFIKMGMNDRSHSSVYGGMDYAERLAEFEKVYQQAIDDILAAGKANGKIPKITLITPTPKSNDTIWNKEQFDDESVWPFALKVKEIAENNGFGCVDFMTAFCEEQERLGDDYYYMFFSDDSDGAIHPNQAAHHFMFKVVSKTIGIYDEESPWYQMTYEDLKDYPLYPDLTTTTSELNNDMPVLADGTMPMAYLDFDEYNGEFDGTDKTVVDLTTLKNGNGADIEGDTLTSDEMAGLNKEYTMVVRAKLNATGSAHGTPFYVTSDSTKRFTKAETLMFGVPGTTKDRFYVMRWTPGSATSDEYGDIRHAFSSDSDYNTGRKDVTAYTDSNQNISGTDAWHTLVISQSANSVNIYMDGTKIDGGTISTWRETLGQGFDNASNFAAYFGRAVDPEGTDQYYLNASVDYAQFYSTALTGAQIQELSETTTVTTESYNPGTNLTVTSKALSTARPKNTSMVWGIAGSTQMATVSTVDGHRTLFRELENAIRYQANRSYIRCLRAAFPGEGMSYLNDNYTEIFGDIAPEVLLVLPEIPEVYDENYVHTKAKVEAYQLDVLDILKKSNAGVKILLTPIPATDSVINSYIDDYADAIRQIAAANASLPYYDLNSYVNDQMTNDAVVRNWLDEDGTLKPLGALEFAKAILTDLAGQGLPFETNTDGTPDLVILDQHTYRDDGKDQSKFMSSKTYRVDNVRTDVKVSGENITVDVTNIKEKYPSATDFTFAWLPCVGCTNGNEKIRTMEVTQHSEDAYTFAAPTTDAVITVYAKVGNLTYRFKDTKVDVTVSGAGYQDPIPMPSSVTLEHLEVAGAPAIPLESGATKYGVELYQYQRTIQILAEAQDGLTIKVEGKEVTSGEFSQNISVGIDETKTVEVSVSDGKSTKTYEIEVTRPAYPDIYVTEVVINGADYSYTGTDGKTKTYDGYELIEIYNASGKTLNLKDYSIGYKEDRVRVETKAKTDWPYYFTGNTQAFNGLVSYTGINQITKYSDTMGKTEPSKIDFPANSTMVLWVKYTPTNADKSVEDPRTFETLISAITPNSLQKTIDGENYTILPNLDQIAVAEIPQTSKPNRHGYATNNRANTEYSANDTYNFYMHQLQGVEGVDVAAATNGYQYINQKGYTYRGWLFLLNNKAQVDSKGQITEAGDDIHTAANYVRIFANADEGTSTFFTYDVERGMSVIPNAGTYEYTDSGATTAKSASETKFYTSDQQSYNLYNTFGVIEYTQKPLNLSDTQKAVIKDNTELSKSAQVSLDITDNTDIRYMEMNVRLDSSSEWTTIKKDFVLESGVKSAKHIAEDTLSYTFTYDLPAGTEYVEYYGYVIDGNGQKTTLGSAKMPGNSDSCEETVELANDISQYRSGDEYTYPTKTGYIFAGWYANEACAEEDAIDPKETSGKAYAKFVPKDIMEVKAQVSSNLMDGVSDGEKGAIRFVTSVDSLQYNNIGFEFTIGNQTPIYRSSASVYTRLYAVGATKGTPLEYVPRYTFCTYASYFKAWSFYNMPASSFDTEIKARPFWETLDGTIVYGDSVSRTVNQCMTTDEAEMDGTYFDTLEEAIEEAPTNGTLTEIRVLRDVELDRSAVIKDGQNIVLTDSGGKRTIQRAATYQGVKKSLFIVNEGGKLTLEGTSGDDENPTLIIDGNDNGDQKTKTYTQLVQCGTKTTHVDKNNMAKVTMKSGVSLQNNASSFGGGVLVFGFFDMQGGVIQNNRSYGNNGGGVAIYTYGSMTMSGGIIRNNATEGGEYDGGGIHTNAENTSNPRTGYALEITGGTITGNEAAHNGGALTLRAGCRAKITGGTISGNTSGTPHMEGIRMANVDLHMGGSAVVDHIWLPEGETIIVDETFTTTEDDAICLALQSGDYSAGTQVLSGNAVSTGHTKFKTLNESVTINTQGKLEASGKTYTNVAQIGSTKYTSLQAAFDAIPTNGTKTTVKLIGDITMAAGDVATLNANQNVVLTNDGMVRTIKRADGNNAKQLIIINQGAKLTLDGTGTDEVPTLILDGNHVSSTSTANQLISVGTSNSTNTSDVAATLLNMENGVVLKNNQSGFGGAVIVYGTFNMKGGFVTENKSSGNGGAVAMHNSGVMTMSGGEITNNTATSRGGAIHVNYSTSYVRAAKAFTMTDGTITGNHADSNSGAITAQDYCVITGGTITDNTASDRPGVAVTNHDLTIGGDAVIDQIWLASTRHIVVNPALTKDQTIALTFGDNTHVAGDTILSGAGVSDSYTKFALPTSMSAFTIGSDGKLATK